MTYFPAGHDVVLFGGYGEIGLGPVVFYQDTWTFASGAWSEAISNTSCTPSTCPSPRADAMVAYYAPDQALLLFGGYSYSPNITYIPYGDTWLYANGAWKNVTADVGPAPSARFAGVMTWDSFDNQIVLFGGSDALGNTIGDTWVFNGTWNNISASMLERPEPRAGAAIADSPSGYLLMYGGESDGATIFDSFCGNSLVAWWFYRDVWTPMNETYCIAGPRELPTATHPSVANGFYPPCGRVNPALGWGPKNARFVLYGGIGPLNESGCTGFDGFLNDTWTFENAPGGGWAWFNATDSGDPPARAEMGYASDFSDGYFEIFGGYDGYTVGLNETWRFFELVHARLSGPSDIDTSGALSFQIPFSVTGYGGSGNLEYLFLTPTGIKNANTISGCSNLTDGATAPLPYDGVAQVPCTPTPTSYNVYHLTVYVIDAANTSDFATANWTFTISPPEFMAIYSQYDGYFYTGLNFPDNLGIRAEVAGVAATSVTANIGGIPVAFTQSGSGSFWWTGSVNINQLSPGPLELSATAQFEGNWELNSTFNLNVVDTPNWLLSIMVYPGITQTVTSQGAGPYNESYTVTEAFAWELDQVIGFNLTIPLAGGNYSLVPSIQVSIAATSTGNLSITGQLGLKPPTISIGPASMNLTIAFALKGNFILGIENGSISTVTWVSAVATFQVSAQISVGIPIYGFSILGVNVGFYLNITVSPSITIGLILAPTAPGNEEFISGIQAKIEQFVGSFYLALAVSVGFGIGIASIAIGGQLSIAIGFATAAGLYISGGWVNGSVFVSATFLWYSTNWTLLSGTIASWSNPPPARPAAESLATVERYNNGTNATWGLQPRYYAGPSYDAQAWNPANDTGTAVSDIYPWTVVTAAAGSTGTYLLFTNDDTSQPVAQGLGISSLELNDTSNTLAGIPPPSDPGFVVAAPQATTLANGNIYVSWEAVPLAEQTLTSPLELSSVALHGATFYPSNRTWGPVRDWTSGGIVQSYQVDASGGTPTLAALVSPDALLQSGSAERLVSFDLASGDEVTNTSVTGLSTLTGVRGALGDVIGRTLGGNYTLVSLASGTQTPISYGAPSSSELVSAAFATGSSSTLVLLYRGTYTSTLVLYDVSNSLLVGTLGLGNGVYEAEAFAGGASYSVFVRTGGSILGWTLAGGVFRNLTTIQEPHVTSYGLAQFGTGLLVYSLISEGNHTSPIVSLDLVELGGTLTPVSSPSSTTASTSSSSPPSIWYWIGLAIVGAGVALLLAVVAIRSRRPPSAASSSDSPPPEGPQAPPGQDAATGPAGGEGR